MSQISKRRALTEACEVADYLGVDCYIVGGVVRDFLLSVDKTSTSSDLDLTIDGDGLTFARTFQERVGGLLKEHKAFLTAKIVAPFINVETEEGVSEIDIATCRTEIYPSPGSLPVVTATSIDRDLLRRDFSVNALALPAEEYKVFLCTGSLELSRIKDPCDGRKDLIRRHLRVLHSQSFRDDPTRLFRAVRYAVRFDFELEHQTKKWFEEAVAERFTASLSPMRVYNELKIMFSESFAPQILQQVESSGLFRPEVLDKHHLRLLVDALKRLWSCAIAPDFQQLSASSAEIIFLTLCLKNHGENAMVVYNVPKTLKKEVRIVLDAFQNQSEVSSMRPLLFALYGLTGKQGLFERLRLKNIVS